MIFPSAACTMPMLSEGTVANLKKRYVPAAPGAVPVTLCRLWKDSYSDWGAQPDLLSSTPILGVLVSLLRLRTVRAAQGEREKGKKERDSERGKGEQQVEEMCISYVISEDGKEQTPSPRLKTQRFTCSSVMRSALLLCHCQETKAKWRSFTQPAEISELLTFQNTRGTVHCCARSHDFFLHPFLHEASPGSSSIQALESLSYSAN